MNATFQPVLALVRAVAIEPAVCKRTAMVMADLHDINGGLLKASMASLAALAGLSTPQVRKHVHALIALGVLEVTANAHGGAPGAVPHYRFNLTRLQAMATHAGHSADLFDFAQQRAPTHRFLSHGGAQMVAQLIGRPGQRQVQFYREAPQGLRDYGQVPLSMVLRPWRVEGGWEAAVFPVVEHDDDNFQEEIHPGEYEKLQQWAQTAALGRTESVVTA